MTFSVCWSADLWWLITKNSGMTIKDALLQLIMSRWRHINMFLNARSCCQYIQSVYKVTTHFPLYEIDKPHNITDCFLSLCLTLQRIPRKLIHNFLSNPVHSRRDRQTNRQTNGDKHHPFGGGKLLSLVTFGYRSRWSARNLFWLIMQPLYTIRLTYHVWSPYMKVSPSL